MNIFVPSREVIVPSRELVMPRRNFIRDAAMLGSAALMPKSAQSAISLTGASSQYLISSLNNATTNISVFCRFKLSTIVGNQILFVAGDTVQANMNYLLTIANTGLWAGTYNGGGNAAQISGLSLSTGVWYAMLGVWTNAAERIVYDGTTRVAETTNAPLTSTNRTLFGAQMLAGVISSYATVTIADMAIWGTALITAVQIDLGEVNAMFQGVSPKHIRPQALTDYWPQWNPGSSNALGIRGNVLTATNSPADDPANPRNYP